MKTIYTNGCNISDYKPLFKHGDKYAVCISMMQIDDVEYAYRKGVRYEINRKPSGRCVYNYVVLDKLPSKSEIKNVIEECINDMTSQRIETGFMYDECKINLSKENQANYKRAYDLAMQTNGANLPFTIKCSKDSKMRYITFANTVEFTKFFVAMDAHINKCLKECWEQKDSIDYSIYVL